MGNIAIVTGIPGTGKTTVVSGVLDHLKTYKEVNYGTVMVEIAKGRKLVKERDELRKLPKETQREIQDAAAEEIANMAKEGNVLIDSHCSIKTQKGYMPAFPMHVLTLIKPNQFILLESDDKEIYGRRQKDESRKRDEDTIEMIHEHQMINRYYAAAYTAAVGAFLSTVKNHDGRLKDAIKQMVELLK